MSGYKDILGQQKGITPPVRPRLRLGRLGQLHGLPPARLRGSDWSDPAKTGQKTGSRVWAVGSSLRLQGFGIGGLQVWLKRGPPKRTIKIFVAWGNRGK